METLEIVRRRLARQHLSTPPLASPADVVGFLGAVQAQEYPEAKWSLSQRSGDPPDSEVEAAIERGEILRTHIMRPTWHFVLPADIVWMQRLTAPRVQAGNRSRYRDLELDEATRARGAEVMLEALEPGEPLTRTELGDALERSSITARGERLAHIVMYAELEALICNGPRRGKQHTYLTLSPRASKRRDLEGDEARAELARRFFTSHGPARIKDFNWWSGLKVGDCRAGLASIRDELESFRDGDGEDWYAADFGGVPPGGTLMLGMYDEVGVGYRDPRIVYAAERPEGFTLQRQVQIDGVCVGSWKRTLEREAVEVEVTLIRALNNDEEAGLRREVDRFGHFIALKPRLRVVGP
ncbi:MAG: winged helix DNA-binding domain-containing protein [Solirubrobacterales bacterium]|nr:winged helix DNA-binding domain-containing protein [Solirubrobacterales bacterium]